MVHKCHSCGFGVCKLNGFGVNERDYCSLFRHNLLLSAWIGCLFMLLCRFIPHTALLPSSSFIIFIVFYSRTVSISQRFHVGACREVMTELNAKFFGCKNVNCRFRLLDLDASLD